MDTRTSLATADPYTVRGLLSRIKVEESRRVKDVASLTFQLTQQKKKSQKLENEAKIERDKRRFKENELVHLKLALDRAYDTIDRLEKKRAACEENHVHTNEVHKIEERGAVLQAKLLDKESALFAAVSKVDEVKKSNETLRRENIVVKAKYEQLLRSEHALALEVRTLQADLDALKQANDRRAELVSSLKSSDREETIKTLLRVGRNLPGSCNEQMSPHTYHQKYPYSNQPERYHHEHYRTNSRKVHLDRDAISDDGSSDALSL